MTATIMLNWTASVNRPNNAALISSQQVPTYGTKPRRFSLAFANPLVVLGFCALDKSLRFVSTGTPTKHIVRRVSVGWRGCQRRDHQTKAFKEHRSITNNIIHEAEPNSHYSCFYWKYASNNSIRYTSSGKSSSDAVIRKHNWPLANREETPTYHK